MASRILPITKAPKYERIQHLAGRYPDFDPEAVSTALVLSAVAEKITLAIHTNLTRFGISQGRFLILAILMEQYPQPLIHSEFAEEFGVTKGNITGLVDGLERDGYVKREKKENDRRASAIVLTKSGQKLISEALPDNLRFTTKFMSKLSAADRKVLVSLLLKVQAGLESYEE